MGSVPKSLRSNFCLKIGVRNKPQVHKINTILMIDANPLSHVAKRYNKF